MRSLMAMAIQFLPANYKYSSVLSATREVVAGVRFRLFVSAESPNATEVVCFLDILEKPWITTDFGQKLRVLQFTNCTENGEEFVPAPTPDPKTVNINPIFTRNRDVPMTEERLGDLEGQIMTGTPQKRIAMDNAEAPKQPEQEEIMTRTNVEQVESQPEAPTTPPTINNELQAQIQAALENIFNNNEELKKALDEITATSANVNEIKERYVAVFDQLTQAIVQSIYNHSESANDSFSYEFPIKFNHETPNSQVTGAIVYVEKEVVPTKNAEEEQEKREKRAIGQPQGKNVESKTLVHVKEQIVHRVSETICQSCKANRANLPQHDCEKYCKSENEIGQEYPIVGGLLPADPETITKVEGHSRNAVSQLRHTDGSACNFQKVANVSKQVVSGILYRATVHHECGGEDKTCSIEIWDQPWLGPPQNKWTCDEYKNHKISKRGVPGGHNELDDEKKQRAEELARTEVPKKGLLAGEQCEFVRVVKGSYQVVAGILYHLTTEVSCGGEKRQCEHQIYERAWENHVETKKYECSAVSSRRRRDTLVGGVEQVDESEFGTLEQMVVDALSYASAKDDNKNYNFIKIKSATKQLVSGVSYQITVMTKDDDQNDIQCTLRIWSQPWKREGNDVKMTCDEVTYKFRTKRSLRSHHHQHLHEGRLYTNKGEEHMQRLFDKYKIKHRRQYKDNDEHERRYKIFKQNLYKIEQLNRMEQGTAKYGITDFADLTKEEYMQRTGLRVPEDHENRVKNPMADIMTDLELPEEYDWRKKQVVSEVKNQGSCGSCWAFSAVGNIEGQHAIKYGKLESYSEQELVDCDNTDHGCGGGYMDDAFKAIENLGGIELESEYPYSAHREKCEFDSSKVHARVKGAVDLPKNETAIAQFLVQNGPISVGLNAAAMQFYRGGVSKPWKILCAAKKIDHGVLLVGYGTASYPRFNKTLPYWIIKNSWGPKWGEQGYYRLWRGDNRCGIAEMASSAVIE
ncbi:putative cysteine proteinase CG12163 isoform X2 [Culicoides brevitarsis]